MKTWITALTLILIAFALGFAPEAMAANAPSKRDMIERLKKLKETQASELTTLEAAIRKKLAESMTLNVSKEEVRFATQKAGMLASKLDELNSRRAELNARREMIDRLIFAVDSKYSNQPLQQFLEQQFLEMASTDLSEARDSRMWKAYTYFSIAIREVPEPREDMFNVIESYMNYSNVLNPKTPAEFLASRNYTNGVESVAARPVDRGSIGDEVDDEAGVKPANTRSMSLELTLPSKPLPALAPQSNSGVKTIAAPGPTASRETVSGVSQAAEPLPVNPAPATATN